jgi:hypothetical protein
VRKAGGGGSDPTTAAKSIMSRRKVKISAPMKGSAAQSTIEAVMYSLRAGTAVLVHDDVRARLTGIDEAQLLEMIDLLQKRDGKIAPHWSDEEVEQLMQTWMACHG